MFVIFVRDEHYQIVLHRYVCARLFLTLTNIHTHILIQMDLTDRFEEYDLKCNFHDTVISLSRLSTEQL